MMTANERWGTFGLALLFALRMLGLFMVLPVLSVKANALEGTTGFTIGLAIGIYGLTQAILQIPFGSWSDRFGRKPMIYIGLILFILGSLVCALADNIYVLIIGRAIQGAGAISAVVMALVSDITREEVRTTAMALIGASIGVAFAVALIVGPIVADHWGLSGLFFGVALLGLFGMFLLYRLVPSPSIVHSTAPKIMLHDLKMLTRRSDLLRLNFGIFILHMMLTALFVFLPQVLLETHQLKVADHWHVYFPVVAASFILMVPLIIWSEKRQASRTLLLGAILLLGASFLTIRYVYIQWTGLFIGLLMFFVAFNILEASLPSIVSKLCPAGKRGSTMGLYSTSQFLGAFVGGSIGGLLYQNFDLETVLFIMAAITLLWWLVTLSLPPIKPAKTMSIALPAHLIGRDFPLVEAQLMRLPGVYDVDIQHQQKIANLKVHPHIFAMSSLDDIQWNQNSAIS
ncbi:MAG: MFS transporter [Pseudomonadota bacterium]